MPKKIRKPRPVRLVMLNIKLRSSEREGCDAYFELLHDVYEKRLIGKPKRGNSVILRTQHSKEIDNQKILYGKISRFTNLDSDDWIDLDKMEIASFEIPENLFPNLKETEYFFIPKAHRFCMKKSQALSVTQVEEFFNKVLKECLKTGEEFEVCIEQDSDTIQQILNARAIRRVEVEISYTNNDMKDEAEEYVEDIFKEMQATRAKMVMEPDHHNHLSIDNKFLRGVIKLAKSNGYVKAKIVDAKNKVKNIFTKKHPEIIAVNIQNADSTVEDVTEEIMTKYKRNVTTK